MTVADLIRELQALPQHVRVVIPLDPLSDELDQTIEVGEATHEGPFILIRGQE